MIILNIQTYAELAIPPPNKNQSPKIFKMDTEPFLTVPQKSKKNIRQNKITKTIQVDDLTTAM